MERPQSARALAHLLLGLPVHGESVAKAWSVGKLLHGIDAVRQNRRVTPETLELREGDFGVPINNVRGVRLDRRTVRGEHQNRVGEVLREPDDLERGQAWETALYRSRSFLEKRDSRVPRLAIDHLPTENLDLAPGKPVFRLVGNLPVEAISDHFVLRRHVLGGLGPIEALTPRLVPYLPGIGRRLVENGLLDGGWVPQGLAIRPDLLGSRPGLSLGDRETFRAA